MRGLLPGYFLIHTKIANSLAALTLTASLDPAMLHSLRRILRTRSVWSSSPGLRSSRCGSISGGMSLLPLTVAPPADLISEAFDVPASVKVVRFFHRG
eukprot:189095-Amphidinium_carterae.1